MKKLLLILVILLTAVTAWASSSTATEGADNRDIGYKYTFNSETGELSLLYDEFSKDNKWGSDVNPSSVKSVTATGNVSFVGDCSELFSGFNNCTSMYLNGVFTGEATNMSKMFNGCSSLTTLEISNWNTYNVTNMSNMFSGCLMLPSLELSGWNTENVTDMSLMFLNCALSIPASGGTASLDLSGWDTGNVTNMSMMFDYCGFNSLNLSGWNVGKVTNMTSMFMGSTVTSLDLSGWNNINITYLTSFFITCTNLRTVNLTGWDISKVTAMQGMFSHCSNLTTIYASTSWDAGNIPADNTSNMFDYCNNLVGGMGTTFDSNYTDNTYARIDRGAVQPGYFTGVFTLSLPTDVTASPIPVCTLGGARYYAAGSTVTLTYDGEVPQGKILIYKVNGTQIEGNTFQMPLDDVTVTYEINGLPCNYTYDSETGALTLISGEFSKNKKWGSDVVANAVTSVTATNQVGFAGDCSELFKGFTNCTSMDLGSASTSEVTNLSEMFRECQSLTSIDLSGWNTSKVTNMLYLFYKCTNLKSINLSGWDLGQTTNMISTFRECDSLNTIYVSTSWDVGNVNISLSMFAYCYELVGGCGTTFSADHTDVEYARIDRGTEEPGYLTGVFTLSLPNDVMASPNPVCTLSGADYYATGETVTLTYRGTVPEGKMVVYSVNDIPIEGNTFQMPLDDVTVTVTFRNLPIEVAVGDLTFNMIKVDGNDEISTFYIAECEVTEALWLAVMGGDNPSSFQGNLEDNRPVENISWNNCQEFIAKLKQMTRLDFRLPTSAEWLFAASGGNDTHGYTYSGSNTIDDVAWYASNCEQKQTVGTKVPNELGIYDMSGNVYEIIQEATGAYGGGWHSPAKNCKVNYYWPANEDYTDNDTGFRLALTNFDSTSVLGDVNGDGAVTSADVTCVYNYLLNNDETFIDTCDVNGDGAVTSADVTVIYNILLGNKKK